MLIAHEGEYRERENDDERSDEEITASRNAEEHIEEMTRSGEHEHETEKSKEKENRSGDSGANECLDLIFGGLNKCLCIGKCALCNEIEE